MSGKRWLLIAALVAVVAVPQGARAVQIFNIGNLLNMDCNKGAGFSEGFCRGYIAGVADTMAEGAAHPKRGGRRACIPLGVTLDQAVDVVTRHLADHPQDRHLAADGLVARALSEAWPCP